MCISGRFFPCLVYLWIILDCFLSSWLFAACPDLMPVPGLWVILPLLLCLLVIDPVCSTTFSIKLHFNQNWSSICWSLITEDFANTRSSSTASTNHGFIRPSEPTTCSSPPAGTTNDTDGGAWWMRFGVYVSQLQIQRLVSRARTHYLLPLLPLTLAWLFLRSLMEIPWSVRDFCCSVHCLSNNNQSGTSLIPVRSPLCVHYSLKRL